MFVLIMEETSCTRTQASLSLSDLHDLSCGSPDLKDGLPLKSILRTDSLDTRASLKSPKSDAGRLGKPNVAGVPRVGNFQASFLPSSMWPELSYEDQFALKKNYVELQIAYCAEVKTETSLKTVAAQAPLSGPCTTCLEEKRLRVVTEKALSQAVELTHTLLEEVRRLDFELARETQPKKDGKSKGRKGAR